jgi:hypothetical protein
MVSGPFPTGRTHLPFRSPVYLRTRRCEGRLGKLRFLGFDPTGESLATERVFNTPTAGCSLGLDPSKDSGRSLDRDFARSPLTRFVTRARTRALAPQSLDQLPPRLVRPAGKPTGWGEAPSEGFCTEPIPIIRIRRFPGYVFTSRRARHYCQLPTLFGKSANSTRAVRTDRRC